MRRLRIAYVVGSLTLGGSERQMLALAEHLPVDRFEVEFILLGDPGPYADRARQGGARVKSLGPSRSGREGSSQLLSLDSAKKALRYARWARRQRYDIIDAWLFHSYVLAGITRPLTRVPLLVSGRRSMSDHKRAFGPLHRLLDSVATRWSDVIVANADAVAADVIEFERLDRRKVRVIRNGVAASDPPGDEAIETQRQAWHASAGDLVIGCVANYKQGKGQQALINAFAELVNVRPNLQLVLVGDGPMRSSLERQITALDLDGRVLLHGAALDPRPLYPAFDIVVQASETEGLPNVLLEAAVAGRPVIATAAGGTNEIVKHGVTGLLVPVGDKEALIRGLKSLAGNRDLRDRLGAAAREHVLRFFGMERFVAEFVGLYEEMAAGKGLLR